MNSRISMQIRQMQHDKPTRTMDGHYPKRQRSSQIRNDTPRHSRFEMLILFALKTSVPLVHTAICLCCWYLTLSPPLRPHHSPSGEDSSSTFTLMFTLHCRKAVQSQGMKAGCSGCWSNHTEKWPQQVTVIVCLWRALCTRRQRVLKRGGGPGVTVPSCAVSDAENNQF